MLHVRKGDLPNSTSFAKPSSSSKSSDFDIPSVEVKKFTGVRSASLNDVNNKNEINIERNMATILKGDKV